MQKSKLKCPKCKSINLTLVEVWHGHEIVWEQLNGEFDRNEGILEPGDPYKVEASCHKCLHHWTARGILQIDDIIP